MHVRKFAIPVVVFVVLALGGVALANSRSPGHARTNSPVQRIKVFAQAVQLKMIDLGDPGFSLGDQIVFSDNLFTRQNGDKLGIDGVVCTVVGVADAGTGSGTLQCPGTFAIGGGQIVTDGLVKLTGGQTSGTQTVAITGGTGRFRGAGGQISIQFLSNTAANITFSITQ
jgi:hypothetical protein